ncbi:hypothetical protein NK718_00540 [Alsobacter sp. SYSU M60028]|uniref:Uncharacterized protein n=1 Tax=Alsobacter ponti TaxID=2962936 RepID=A0ABT1L6H6_9HYPH|nr:hypothetical protein [Alsobacter ponti]MCP8936991.1 hypothetical protein [Alsobacter ponti]
MKDDPVTPFPQPSGGQTLDLRAAVRRARIEDAERSTVTAELRGAEIARLEMLKERLEPVFLQLPKEAELFDLGLIPGEKPRLFVDMVAFVEMARDRRTFRFIQETRAGRVLLAESDRIEPVAEAVTAYLGRRLVERERALATLADALPAALSEPIEAAAVPAAPQRSTRLSDLLFMLVLGLILGAGLLYCVLLWKTGAVETGFLMDLFRRP